jgi:hypothetical protein
VFFCSYERRVTAGASCGEVAEWLMQRLQEVVEAEVVSSVIVASEVQLLPSPLQLFRYGVVVLVAPELRAR